jgi:hypothetical protein
MARYVEKKMRELKQKAKSNRPSEPNPSKIEYLLPSQMKMFDI